MGADGFLLYYGIRFIVPKESEEEIHGLESLTDTRLVAAASVGLQHWWGLTTEEDYFLLIGTQIGNLGWEGDPHREISDPDLLALFETTRSKLAQAGFSQTPALWAQFEPDF